jgi:hypothetical protein
LLLVFAFFGRRLIVLAFTFVGLTLTVATAVPFTGAGLTLAGSTFTAGTGLLFSGLAIGCELRTASGAGATQASLTDQCLTLPPTHQSLVSLLESQRHAGLAERAVPERPRDRSRQDQRDSRVEQLERPPDLRSSAGRTFCAGPRLGKPGQTTCVALAETSGQHSK